MRLTYCANVHPAEDLAAWFRVHEEHAVPIAAAVRAGGREFGLGAWWNATIARQLAADPAARAGLAEWLDRHDLDVWTLNAFPYGGFHDAAVKTRVYTPHWADPWRVAYTIDVATVVTLLHAARGRGPAVVPISTLPLGFREDSQRRAMAVNLRVVACRLANLRDEHGVHCVLALEPEPNCMLETAAATADFLEQEVFDVAGPLEERLRDHLGVCVDLCHLAVVGEDPVAAWRSLRQREITVPKVQVSSCLELRDPATSLDRLLAFDEPRYLHQTGGDAGRLRALDLADVAARRAEFERCRTIRTHFHLPVFWDAEGPLGSTRRQLRAFLAEMADTDPAEAPLLEVETYTWSVLDEDWRPDRDLVAGILRELDDVAAVLSTSKPGPAEGS